jgi:Peptidase family M28
VAALQPLTERRRARPGSIDRPVNGRLYRGTWLLVGLPLLVLAFSVARPAPLQPPNLPPAFDESVARQLATDLAAVAPSRVAGTSGDAAAANWFAGQLAPFGFTVRRERFSAVVPGRGRVRFVNLIASKAGLSQKTIVVMAHRDNTGVGPGANDNGSGTSSLGRMRRTGTPHASGCRTP